MEDTKMLEDEHEPKETEALERDKSYSRQASNKSTASYGATSEERRPSLRRRGSGGRYLKRMSSTPTTDRPFTRQSSQISSIPSGKSLTSRKSITRTTSVSRSEYHDDLKPDLRAPANINLIFATFVVSFGESFLFGWNIGVLNQPSMLIKDFINQTYSERGLEEGEPIQYISETTILLVWSLINSLFIPGGMIGAFLGGAVADKLGRKRGIMFSHIFTVIGAIMSCVCVAARAPELLMVGRILLGINNGLGNCLAPMFLTEIAPYNLRGALGTVHQLSITLGILVSSVFGIKQILGTPEGWPFLMLLELASAIVACAALPFLPETPRYLLLCKGDRTAAEKSLEFYRRSDDVVTELEEMDTEHIQKSKTEEKYTLKQFCQDKTNYRPLAIACMLQVAQQFSGINAVFFYSGDIFLKAGVGATQIPFTIIGTNAVNVAMTVIAVPMMELTGRRPLLLFPMLMMVLDLIMLTVAIHFQEQYSWLAYLSIVAIIIYVIGFAVGLGPIPMMIGSELFRQGPRPIAMAGAGVINWISTFIIAMAFEPIKNVIEEYVFVIFLLLLILFAALIYFLVPETKDKTFEEIAHKFSPGADLEVEEQVEVDDDDVFDNEAPPAAPNEDGDGEDHQLVTLNFKPGGDKGDDKEKLENSSKV